MWEERHRCAATTTSSPRCVRLSVDPVDDTFSARPSRDRRLSPCQRCDRSAVCRDCHRPRRGRSDRRSDVRGARSGDRLDRGPKRRRLESPFLTTRRFGPSLMRQGAVQRGGAEGRSAPALRWCHVQPLRGGGSLESRSTSRVETNPAWSVSPSALTILPKERLLSGMDALLGRISDPASLRGSMVLTTGLSRTADIEQVLGRSSCRFDEPCCS